MNNILHCHIYNLILLLIMSGYRVSAASEYLDLGNNMSKEIQQLHQDQIDTQELVSQLADEVKDMKTYLRELLPTDCYAAKLRGSWTSKTLVSPPGLRPRQVQCDQQSEGGGWMLVLQRQPPIQHSRMHHSTRENFNCSWDTYKSQFGSLDGEFWIGLDVLHALTSEIPHELLVKITDEHGNSKQAQWKTFRVSSEDDDFRLTIAEYQRDSSDMHDALSYHNGMPFSTFDRDNSQYEHAHCGNNYGGGWWYSKCHHALLTGDPSTSHMSKLHGIRWNNKSPQGRSNWLVLKYAQMMIRPQLLP